MDDETLHGSGWSEYQRLVLNELQRHGTALLLVNQQMTEIKIELGRLPDLLDRTAQLEAQVDRNMEAIAALQVKAGLWGAFGGLGAGLVVYLARLSGG